MTNSEKFAQVEFETLAQVNPNSELILFKKDILNLCETFAKSGQSGASAPALAGYIADVIQKILLFEPITPIMDFGFEWFDHGGTLYQNLRCPSLFKDKSGESHYNDAIVWNGEDKYDRFRGRVYLDDNTYEEIRSSQRVKFPFTPKTFYVDVIKIFISQQEAAHRNLDVFVGGNGERYYYVVKDLKQIDEVFKYYVPNEQMKNYLLNKFNDNI